MEQVVWTDKRFYELSRWMREDIARLDSEVRELREGIYYSKRKREEALLRWLSYAAMAIAILAWVVALLVYTAPS